MEHKTKKQRLYLDHNATTPVKPQVRDVILSCLESPGNPSSVHASGRLARRLLEEAREKILSALKAGKGSALIFTSGATEANNMVLRTCGAERILVSDIEHPSVMQAAGSEVETIPVTPDGVLDLEALEEKLKAASKTTLVSVMLVNNETGGIQPLKEVIALARKYGALVHTDAVQAIGRVPVTFSDLDVDYLTLSGHKIGGPQGTGALIVRNCAPIGPLLLGGKQEKGKRGGTENLPGILGLVKAVELAVEDIKLFQSLSSLRDQIENEIIKTVPEALFFGQGADRVSNTSFFALPDIPAENVLLALDMAGVEISNGSACASGTVGLSSVVKAMGREDLTQGSLRISLGWNTTQEDINRFVEIWGRVIGRIQQRVKEEKKARG